ncbi:MAG: hypothetical protein O3A82_16795 [Verrucomicrobia bacterium]|nr:hypothetical protein [Verrucomicrobiota bacterium]MDA0725769.1 hypothetical protein [Verrucomicrobiota bacterium]MDA1048570.1 hypothetical protein [Verrucomicrobiota bacterium]
MKNRQTLSRRHFISSAATASIATPMILSAKKSQSKQLVMGEGEHRFEVHHDWAQLPDKFTWQTTHNVAVDKAGNVYVIHEGRANLKDHPSIFVFDPNGKFVRAFGNQFQGGGHGLEVRQEGNEEFLYVCAYQNVKAFAKLTLKGETVWEKYAPMDSGVYRKDEDTVRVKRWGRDAFLPTNFAFLDDGGFLLADGYGSFWIHRYDKDANWVSKFGGPGKGEGKFATPHGIWIDRRPGLDEKVVICDRAHGTLQLLTLEGKYLETIKGYGMPANVDTWKNLLLVPELHARVTLLNEKNEVVAHLGDDVEGVVKKKKVSRGNAKTWVDGKFVHPHDACFGANGDIYVAEWVSTGRVTKLKRLS